MHIARSPPAAGLAAAALLTSAAAAQDPPTVAAARPRDRGRRAAPHGGRRFGVAQPRGAFRRHVDNGFGVQGHALYRVDRAGALRRAPRRRRDALRVARRCAPRSAPGRAAGGSSST
jgi:hypothetical protein